MENLIIWVKFYIFDYFREYGIPTIRNASGMTIETIWDGTMAEKVLSGLFKDDLDTKMKQAFKQLFSNKLDCADCLNEEQYGDVYELTIDSRAIKEYLELWKIETIRIIEEASGDDEFYDYMPGYVDMFKQLCSQANAEQFFNETIKPYQMDERYSEALGVWDLNN